jgi:DNA-binding PadR family transcriptional regulator
MERHTTTGQTALYILTIRQESTKFVRRKSYRLTPERAEYFAKLLNVTQNGFTLLNIEPD